MDLITFSVVTFISDSESLSDDLQDMTAHLSHICIFVTILHRSACLMGLAPDLCVWPHLQKICIFDAIFHRSVYLMGLSTDLYVWPHLQKISLYDAICADLYV